MFRCGYDCRLSALSLEDPVKYDLMEENMDDTEAPVPSAFVSPDCGDDSDL